MLRVDLNLFWIIRTALRGLPPWLENRTVDPSFTTSQSSDDSAEEEPIPMTAMHLTVSPFN